MKKLRKTELNKIKPNIFEGVIIKTEGNNMTEKDKVLKELYPEDMLNISTELTECEVKFLQQLYEMLETKYRDSITDQWVNATVPEDFFYDMGKLNYFRNPLLFEGR